MKTKIKFFLFILTAIILISHSTKAYSFNLSPQARISLLTASPGEELYSVFGHSAIRVQDSLNSLDLVFNYGTFDFSTPGFYTKFVRGKLPYMLSIEPFVNFVPEYYMEGRSIDEQVLNLSQEEKQEIMDFLLINRLPENRFYQYDFFYDNCATRIRDLVHQIISPLWNEKTDSEMSFRDLISLYLTQHPWSKFGIDLVLGLPCDKVASAWEYQFLPDFMFLAFKDASKPDGQALVSETISIIDKHPFDTNNSFFSPILVMWLVFALALLSTIHPAASKIFDAFFFIILGFLGILIVFLWFGTDHQTARHNLNILWALPTHLLFIFPALRKQASVWVKRYFLFSGCLALALMLVWYWVPQQYHPAFFPLVAASALKSLKMAGVFKNIRVFGKN